MFNGRIVKRKWGFYITLLDRKHFKVKLLRFKKGGQLSIQLHDFRNELWLFMKDGDYQLIPAKTLHTHYAKNPEYVLEVQYGERCEEEDIVRL